MRRAIELGERGRLSLSGTDPWVGCVLVADGQVVGEGGHDRDGGPHAEAVALEQAGRRARGSTAYVTLEPCNHEARTPPCTEALISAGVACVVVGVTDADPRVQGEGVDRLRNAGITVEVGVAATEVFDSLRPYLHHRAAGRPWCVLKAAVSLDGRTAAVDGTSQWITGPDARADGHRLRALSDAVVVGSGTALADRPALTVRDFDPRPSEPPLRVLLDARGRVPAVGPLFEVDVAPTLIMTTAAADPDAVREWKGAGAEVVELEGSPAGGVDLESALRVLHERRVLQALVEGGAAVHGSLAAADLADEVVLYVGGSALGPGGRPLFDGLSVPTLSDALRWSLTDVARVGTDARITWRRAV
ncbi:MAG: bifunctional diaminohydroxyphosphoribosylaminopyrimidine deaminase/5-amino-6-(5-phosphoribosylamino)uracil reductase RibD [Actinobacteria bacterium]|nr:bifunctional diaminohydroxyphosphoribosylaminopyrimidine deaminase/5-amino-6-(5-phosphoribosylamino)uracil reductase RibD [Actinomycetota bacterium]